MAKKDEEEDEDMDDEEEDEDFDEEEFDDEGTTNKCFSFCLF